MESSNVVAGANAKASEYNALRDDVVLGNKIVGTDTDGSTVTFDMSVPTKGNIRQVTLGGNRTLALSNVSVGQVFIIRLVQPAASAGKTVTWWSGIKWPGEVAPVLSTGVNDIDVFGFICTAAATYDGFFVGFDLG